MKPNLKFGGTTGYMIVEALVYAGVSVVLLGVAFAAMYRCIDSSVALRRSADDLTGALHAGERWRADVRGARAIKLENLAAEQVLYLKSAEGEVDYRAVDGAVFRRFGGGAWTRVLANVSSSNMQPDPRETVAAAWRWELQLKTRAKTSRIHPLFTFIAVPASGSTP